MGTNANIPLNKYLIKRLSILAKVCGDVGSRTIFSTGNRLFVQTRTTSKLSTPFANYIGILFSVVLFAILSTNSFYAVVRIEAFSAQYFLND